MARTLFDRRNFQYLKDPEDEIAELNEYTSRWEERQNGYAEYLDSEDWQQKKELVKKRDGYCCAKCGGSEGLQVHHKWYSPNRQKQPLSSLITLCNKCHELEHGH